MYLLYFGDIPNLVSCAFSTIPIFPPFNSQNFLFTCNIMFGYNIHGVKHSHAPIQMDCNVRTALAVLNSLNNIPAGVVIHLLKYNII